MPTHELAAYLYEPAPCDDCASAQVCKYTGAACAAFSRYLNSQPWEGIAREPTLKRGKTLGIKAAEMTDAERAWLLAVARE